MKKVNFYSIDTDLPDYKDIYEGSFVMDVNNRFFIGTKQGWKEIPLI